jgi:hypothetical protein
MISSADGVNVRNVSTVRSRIGLSLSIINCFAMLPPILVPEPPATITAYRLRAINSIVIYDGKINY